MAHDAPASPMRFAHDSLSPAIRRAPSNFDEGFSEETLSQVSSDVDMSRDAKDTVDRSLSLTRELEALSLQDRLSVMRNTAASLSAEDQLVFVRDLLGYMPSWAKQQASKHLDSLMFFDPVAYLPYELVSIVFGHLTPSDLLSASGVSHGWREHSQDEELWRSIFRREGWHMDIPKIRNFERKSRDRIRKKATGASAGAGGSGIQRRDSRKRRAGEAFSEGEASAHPADANGAPSADSSAEDSSNEHMEGMELDLGENESGASNGNSGYTPRKSDSASNLQRNTHSRQTSTDSAMSPESILHSTAKDFKLAPTIFQSNTKDDAAKVSWTYLYKQRRLLEKNWDAGKYQAFRLPHPQFPEQGHEECVYTIQHTGDWLVSGSRDRSIRIWDLETNKLREGAPAILMGHAQSVLCLQFDASPDNDIIVSGGSDSWVIIWRFSTGEMIKKMTSAHQESVLNLRFDHRYIVTCSKDKTIKIWNRHAIASDSPVVPSFVVDQFQKYGGVDVIKEHTLLAKLVGHGAAVNAVMIHEDTIVSASGDRTIRAWNIQTGKCDKQYIGHTKGIACVQYDGRRIISGSSDNTVRIFDAERQAEVACLTGHSNLVRTVQARFGDLETMTDEELFEQSKAATTGFLEAMDDGMTPASASRSGPRNAGSNKAGDMLAYGTKIPPGGGGSRWAKIVSGSYDETIIIWKKDKDGKWVHRHRLHQDMLLRNSRGRHRREHAGAAPNVNPAPPVPGSMTLQNAGPQQQQHQSNAAQQALTQVNGMATQLNTALQNGHQTQQAPVLSTAQAMTMSASQRGLQANLNTLQNSNAQSSSQIPAPASSHAPAPAQSSAQAPAAAQSSAQAQAQAQAAAPPQPAGPGHFSLQHQPNAVLSAAQAHAMIQAGPHANILHVPHAPQRESSNRVFKLQFDARRIVCCSQNKVIVGWDFANGDPDLKNVGNWSLETC